MAEKTLIAKIVEVNCLAHTNYRRAGIAFQHGKNNIKPESITHAQFQQLKADPRLEVNVADETQEAPAETQVSNTDLSSSTGGDGSQSESVDESDSSSSLEEGEDPAPKPKSLTDAIQLLDPSNTEHFTTGGKPQVDVLGELMGVKVSATERDEAWALVQAEQVTADEETPIDTDTEKGE